MDWSTIISLGFKGLAAYLTFKLVLWAIGGFFGVLVAANLAASAIKAIPVLLWRGVRGTPQGPQGYYPPPYYPPPPGYAPPGYYPPQPYPPQHPYHPPPNPELATAPGTPDALPPPAQPPYYPPPPVKKPVITKRLKWLVFTAIAILFLAWNLPGRSTGGAETPNSSQDSDNSGAITYGSVDAVPFPDEPVPENETIMAYPGRLDNNGNLTKGTEPAWSTANMNTLGDSIEKNICQAPDDGVCYVGPSVLKLVDHDMQTRYVWVLFMEWKIMHRWTTVTYCTQVYTLPAAQRDGKWVQIDPFPSNLPDNAFQPDHTPKVAMNLDATWCSRNPGGTHN